MLIDELLTSKWPTREIDEFYDRRKVLLQQKITEHPLEIVIWEATTRCNLRCIHCGTPTEHFSPSTELSSEAVVDAFRQIARDFDLNRIKFVAITGGEPTVRADLVEIVEAIHRIGFKHIVIETNAHRFAQDPNYLQRLVDAGIKGIATDIDGFEPTHNWLRNHPKSFALSVKAFRMVKDFDVDTLISTVITKHSLHELPELKNLIGELSPDRWRLIALEPLGRALEYLRDQLLSMEDMRALVDFVLEQRLNPGGLAVELGCGQWYGQQLEGLVRPYIWHCIAGINVMSILADGSLGACNNIDRQFVQGNVKTSRIRDVWESRYRPFREFQWKKVGECENCDAWDLCHGGDMHMRSADGQMMGNCFYRWLQDKYELGKENGYD